MAYTQTDLDDVKTAIMALATGKRILSRDTAGKTTSFQGMKMEDLLILDGGGISYAVYLGGLVKDTEKTQRVSAILKRRFGYLLTESSLIQSVDIEILKLLNQRVREASGI